MCILFRGAPLLAAPVGCVSSMPRQPPTCGPLCRSHGRCPAVGGASAALGGCCCVLGSRAPASDARTLSRRREDSISRMRRLSRVHLTPLSFNTLPARSLKAPAVWSPSRWGKEGEFCGRASTELGGGRLGHPPLYVEKVLSLQTSVRLCCDPFARPREKAMALLQSQGGRAPWRASSSHSQPSVELGAILCI